MPPETSENPVAIALGEPIGLELPDNALRVRRNLLISSFIALVVAWGGVSISPSASVSGVTFNGLSNTTIRIALLSLTVYHLIHFAWYVYESFEGWRLRVTGTRLAFVTTGTFASEHADYPSDPRQSTLYYWWKAEGTRANNLGQIIEEIRARVATAESELEQIKAERGPPSNLHVLMPILTGIQTEAAKLLRSIEGLNKALDSDRIPVSLSRFDACFSRVLKSGNLRWIVLDVSSPLILGVMAIVTLVPIR